MMKVLQPQLLLLLMTAPLCVFSLDSSKPSTKSTTSSFEFQVNTYTANNQKRASAAELTSGGSVVCWSSGSQDGDSWGIYCQIMDHYGRKIHSEFRANTVTEGLQTESSVCGLENGNFVVIWNHWTTSGLGFDVFGQLFSPSGQRIGSEFQVNEFTNYADHAMSVGIASLANGGFVVVRAADPNFIITYIWGQLFSSDAQKIGPAIRIADENVYRFAKPRVAAFSDSSFVVVFEAADLALEGVYARVYDHQGIPATDLFQCNSFEAYRQSSPSVGVFSDDEFVVSWTTNDDGYDVFVRKFRKTGYPLGTEKRATEWSSGDQRESNVAIINGNRFYVSWMAADSDAHGVYRRRWGQDMQPIGSDERMNQVQSGSQFDPAMTSVQGGTGTMVVWTDDAQDGDLDGIFARFIAPVAPPPSPSPTPLPTPMPTPEPTTTPQPTPVPTPVPGPIPSEFIVNTHTVSDQSNSDSAQLTSGMAIVVWQSIQTGQGFDVFGQLYNPDGSRRGGEFPINQNTVNHQGSPAVCGLAGGGFVVVWNSWIGGSTIDVWGQRFTEQGTPIGDEFQANLQSSATAAMDPDVACQPNGGFVVAFTTHPEWIYVQMYDPVGQKIGNIRSVTSSSGVIPWPRIAAFHNSGFVVVWTGKDGPFPTDYGIQAQIFTAAGDRLGSVITVNQHTQGQQMFPDVATYWDVMQRFIIVWGDEGSIMSQRFTLEGGPILPVEMQVNQYGNEGHQKPRVTALGQSSRLVVVWEYPDGDVNGILAREMSTRGHNYAEDEFQLNSHTQGSQNDVAITDLDGHFKFLATWNDPSLDGDSLGVAGRVSGSNEGNPPPPPTRNFQVK